MTEPPDAAGHASRAAPAFRYRAASVDGRMESGVVHASDREAAVAELRRRGLAPVEVDVDVVRRRVARLGQSAAVSAFTRALAALLGAGVPLDRALRFTAGEAGHPIVAAAASAVRRDVQAGVDLAEAFARHPRIFDRLYVATIAAGEAAGALAPAAERLADYLDEATELRGQARAALLYPALMAVAAGVGVVVLLLVVVPRFVALLGDVGADLPWSTRMLVAISGAAIGWWWLWLALGMAVVVAARSWLASPAHRLRWHAIRLGLPVVGPLEQKLAAARVTRTLGILLRAGTRVVPALRVAASAAPNLAVGAGVEWAAAAVARGERVTDALAPILPPLAAQLLGAGEASGRLADMCLKVAESYDAEVRRALRAAVGLLEPALIVLFGGIVGFIALAMLQAVYSVNVGAL
jgi:type II secretory pathway component PulF